jgi:hypothetical protein
MIFKVHTKLTVNTTKRGQGAAKLSDKVFNALPWYGLERNFLLMLLADYILFFLLATDGFSLARSLSLRSRERELTELSFLAGNL